MFCKKCGNEQKQGEKFCSRCGYPFSEEDRRTIGKNLKDTATKVAGITAKTAGQTKDGAAKAGEAIKEKSSSLSKWIGRLVMGAKQRAKAQNAGQNTSAQQPKLSPRIITYALAAAGVVCVTLGVVWCVNNIGSDRSDPIKQELPSNFDVSGNIVTLHVNATLCNTRPVSVVSGPGCITTKNDYMTERIRVPDGEVWMVAEGELKSHFGGMVISFVNYIAIKRNGNEKITRLNKNTSYLEKLKNLENNTNFAPSGAPMLMGGDEFRIITDLPGGFIYTKDAEVGMSELVVEGDIMFVRLQNK